MMRIRPAWESVRLVIDKASVQADKAMPAVARHLKAVGDNGESAKKQRLLF